MRLIDDGTGEVLILKNQQAEQASPGKSCLLSADNATHLLECRHAIGQHGKTYYMRCHVLKTMPDGRLKLRVFGDRYWNDRGHIERTRYVESHRVMCR